MIEVYPRAYGGTVVRRLGSVGVRGLSPRVRGNHARRRSKRLSVGSIPARTGEPRVARAPNVVDPVYPRAYGGTLITGNAPPAGEGLSPRVRGNHLPRLRRIWRIRSIPARTGEPAPAWSFLFETPVYPRAYGGTRRKRVSHVFLRGLSPRVRGNRLDAPMPRRQPRSIPARTGEPVRARRDAAQLGVYPRAYGGTSVGGVIAPVATGLSPRVRGNLSLATGVDKYRGSIPARTGEPLIVLVRHFCYRRLSPRVRGNPGRLAPSGRPTGSIPARTGEPQRRATLLTTLWVYPRAYGGTIAWWISRRAPNGLSPRVRGNPLGDVENIIEEAVYPRAYGGTPRIPASSSH